MLGFSDCFRIKTQERLRASLEGESIAILTKLGWVVVFSGCNNEITNILFSKTVKSDD